LQELVNAAVDYDEQGVEGLREFIDHSALVSDQDEYKRDAPVTLMTAHSAKGLEFPLVFIVGLEDGLFPHSRARTDAAELEELRREAAILREQLENAVGPQSGLRSARSAHSNRNRVSMPNTSTSRVWSAPWLITLL